jgi:hypothetical protein
MTCLKKPRRGSLSSVQRVQNLTAVSSEMHVPAAGQDNNHPIGLRVAQYRSVITIRRNSQSAVMLPSGNFYSAGARL